MRDPCSDAARGLAAALLAFLAGTAAMAQEKPVLTVYTYDSFASEWGPGPKLETAFEAVCGCELEFIAPGDAAEMLARLRLEGAATPADVVVGLDTSLLETARATGLFAPHDIALPPTDLPVTLADDLFLPFDWGYFAFVYDRTKLARPPGSFEELVAAPKDLRIVIQDPRSSTPGLGLLLWVKEAYGDRAAEIWKGLAPHILTVTRGWSEAYGMFLDGEADMVLSYTTSPAYHLIAEDDASKAAAAFSEGHYLQVELAGRLAGSDQPELARAFLDFLLSETAQAILPVTNWMYPVITPAAGLPPGFETLIQPARALLVAPDRAGAVRDQALEEWQAALGK